jgi:hypothetical protein
MENGDTWKLMIAFLALMVKSLALLNHMVKKFGPCYLKNSGLNTFKATKILNPDLEVKDFPP